MIRRVIDLGLGTVELASGANGAEPAEASRRYGPPSGLRPLRAALAELEGVEPDEVLITTGASLALAATLTQLPRPGEVLLPRPFYPSYLGLVESLGFRPRTYGVRPSLEADAAGVLDLEGLAAQLHDGVRAIVVNTPGNPLGNVVAAAEMAELHALAADHGCLVIADEVYGDFVYERLPGDWRGRGCPPGIVRIKSFSKAFQVPGERIGYAIADREVVQQIGRAHWLLAMSPPVSGQVRAARAVVERDPERFATLLDELRRNRDLTAEALAGCGKLTFRRPRAGIFYWLEVATEMDGTALARHCLERGGVHVTAGALFGVTDPPAIRCSFALASDELREGLHRLVEVVEALY